MELKFRAWHKERKKYYEVSEIDFILKVVEVIDNLIKDFRLCKFEEVIIEQYTGLKDKNGKEIYVGDIVKLVFVDDIKEITEVKSIFEFAQWNWDNVSTVKFIGNIHENKELLD